MGLDGPSAKEHPLNWFFTPILSFFCSFPSETSQNLTDHAAIGFKQLNVTGKNLYVDKQLSPDEIRVWHSLHHRLLNTVTPLLLAPLKTTLKKLSPTEIAVHCDCGLCYNCDERYDPHHKCKAKFFLLITNNDDDLVDPTLSDLTSMVVDDPSSDIGHSDSSSPARISFHDLSGHLTSATLRVDGFVNGHDVVVLIDGGSSHNFVKDGVSRLMTPHCSYFLCIYLSRKFQWGVFTGKCTESSCI